MTSVDISSRQLASDLQGVVTKCTEGNAQPFYGKSPYQGQALVKAQSS